MRRFAMQLWVRCAATAAALLALAAPGHAQASIRAQFTRQEVPMKAVKTRAAAARAMRAATIAAGLVVSIALTAARADAALPFRVAGTVVDGCSCSAPCPCELI